jgi:hypothetical protein
MMLLVHGAVGAACGVLLWRRTPTLVAALGSHFLVDAINHEEPFDEDGDLRVGLLTLDALLLGLMLLLVSARRGALSPESLGALAACALDSEHLLRQRRKRPLLHRLFPHARWPSRRIGIPSQWAIGAVAWLPVLMCAPQREVA